MALPMSCRIAPVMPSALHSTCLLFTHGADVCRCVCRPVLCVPSRVRTNVPSRNPAHHAKYVCAQPVSVDAFPCDRPEGTPVSSGQWLQGTIPASLRPGAYRLGVTFNGVLVRDSHLQRSTAQQPFIVYYPPVCQELSPPCAPALGGTTVTLTGKHLAPQGRFPVLVRFTMRRPRQSLDRFRRMRTQRVVKGTHSLDESTGVETVVFQSPRMPPGEYSVGVSCNSGVVYSDLGDRVRFDAHLTPYIGSVTPRVSTSGRPHPVYVQCGFRQPRLYPRGSYRFRPLSEEPNFVDPHSVRVRYLARPPAASGPSAKAGSSFRFTSERSLKAAESGEGETGSAVSKAALHAIDEMASSVVEEGAGKEEGDGAEGELGSMPWDQRDDARGSSDDDVCSLDDMYEDNVEVGDDWRVLAEVDAVWDPDTGRLIASSPQCMIVESEIHSQRKLRTGVSIRELRNLNRSIFITHAYVQVALDGQHFGGAVPFTIAHSPEISHLSVRTGPAHGGTPLEVSLHLPGVTPTEGVEFAVKFTDDLGSATAGWQRALDRTDEKLVHGQHMLPRRRGDLVTPRSHPGTTADVVGASMTRIGTEATQPSLAEYAEWLEQQKREQDACHTEVVPAEVSATVHGLVVRIKCITPAWAVPLLPPTALEWWHMLAKFVRRGGLRMKRAEARTCWCGVSARDWTSRVRVEVSINGGSSFTETLDASTEFTFFQTPEVTHMEPGAAECDGGKHQDTAILCSLYGHNLAATLHALREMRMREAFAIASAALCARRDEHWGWEDEYGCGVGTGGEGKAFGWRSLRRFGRVDVRDMEVRGGLNVREGLGAAGGEGSDDEDDDAMVRALNAMAAGGGNASTAVAMMGRDAVFFNRDWASVWQRLDLASRIEAEAASYLRMWQENLPRKMKALFSTLHPVQACELGAVLLRFEGAGRVVTVRGFVSPHGIVVFRAPVMPPGEASIAISINGVDYTHLRLAAQADASTDVHASLDDDELFNTSFLRHNKELSMLKRTQTVSPDTLAQHARQGAGRRGNVHTLAAVPEASGSEHRGASGPRQASAQRRPTLFSNTVRRHGQLARFVFFLPAEIVRTAPRVARGEGGTMLTIHGRHFPAVHSRGLFGGAWVKFIPPPPAGSVACFDPDVERQRQRALLVRAPAYAATVQGQRVLVQTPPLHNSDVLVAVSFNRQRYVVATDSPVFVYSPPVLLDVQPPFVPLGQRGVAVHMRMSLVPRHASHDLAVRFVPMKGTQLEWRVDSRAELSEAHNHTVVALLPHVSAQDMRAVMAWSAGVQCGNIKVELAVDGQHFVEVGDLTRQVTFYRPPRVTRVSPAIGWAQGGHRVFIDGGPFVDTGHLHVRFLDVMSGRFEVVPATFVSTTRVSCLHPPWRSASMTPHSDAEEEDKGEEAPTDCVLIVDVALHAQAAFPPPPVIEDLAASVPMSLGQDVEGSNSAEADTADGAGRGGSTPLHASDVAVSAVMAALGGSSVAVADAMGGEVVFGGDAQLVKDLCSTGPTPLRRVALQNLHLKTVRCMQPPRLSSVSPVAGPSRGGTVLTLRCADGSAGFVDETGMMVMFEMLTPRPRKKPTVVESGAFICICFFWGGGCKGLWYVVSTQLTPTLPGTMAVGSSPCRYIQRN